MGNPVEPLQEIRLWMANHDGEEKAQSQFNDQVRKELDAMWTKVNTIESDVQAELQTFMLRMMVIIGVIAATGAAIGGWAAGN